MSENDHIHFPGYPLSTEYYTTFNQSKAIMRSAYDKYNNKDYLVPHELTFTVAPSRCKDIQSAKRNIMHNVKNRIFLSSPTAAMLFRENHENGWPHIHGIGWWPKYADNSLTLSGGRIYQEWREPNKKYAVKKYIHNELGRTEIDHLRKDPYEDKKGRKWDNWFEYIQKDQDIKWQWGNCLIRKINEGLDRFKIEPDVVI